MGVLGGLGATLGVLPAGTAMLAGQSGHRGTDALLHAPIPFTLSAFAAETAPMSFRDRFRIAQGRAGMLVLDLGPYAMSVTASRARGGRLPGRRGGRGNVLATYQLGAAVRTELPGGLTVAGGGTLTYLSQRLGLARFDGRQRHSMIANADLSIARGARDRLTLSYLEIEGGSGRATLTRTIELAAGAPRNANGFRLAFSHQFAGDGLRSLTWGIDLSAMRLSGRDSLLLGEPARAMDRRIAVELDRRF